MPGSASATLEQLVKAAHEVGVKVTVSLVPMEMDATAGRRPAQNPRPRPARHQVASKCRNSNAPSSNGSLKPRRSCQHAKDAERKSPAAARLNLMPKTANKRKIKAQPPSSATACSADIQRLEDALKSALPLAERAHGMVGRAYDGEGGGAPACLGLMEIAVRNLRGSK